jgi:O-antigen ligase
MKKVFYINDSLDNRVTYYHLLLFLFAFPFDRFYCTLILISFITHTTIFISKKQLRKIKPETAIFQSVFFVTLFSTVYSVSFSDSFSVVTRQLAILIFPILLTVTTLNLKIYRSRLLTGLVFSGTLTILYLYSNALYLIWYNHLPLQYIFSRAFVNHNFSLPINMHATYLSMLLVLSIVFSLQQLVKSNSRPSGLFYFVCSLIQLAGVIQLGSKSVIAALFITLVVGFPLFVVKKTHRHVFLFRTLLATASLAIFILSFRVFRERYLLTLKNDLYENRGIVEENGRFDRWSTAFELIRRAPVIGTGSGSEVPLLRNLYYEKKMYVSYLFSLNAHNQYLSFLINSGIAGLLVYLATIGWGLWQSIIKRDILLFSFILLVAVVSLSEDLLDVNKGIFFYAFFFPFLAFSGKAPDDRREFDKSATSMSD